MQTIFNPWSSRQLLERTPEANQVGFSLHIRFHHKATFLDSKSRSYRSKSTETKISQNNRKINRKKNLKSFTRTSNLLTQIAVFTNSSTSCNWPLADCLLPVYHLTFDIFDMSKMLHYLNFGLVFCS